MREEMNKVTDARIAAPCPVCDVGMAVTDFQRRNDLTFV